MEIIILATMALAVIMFLMSRLMAAQNTGYVVPTNAIYMGGGDRGTILYTASEAISPGDNVVSSADGYTVAKCGAGGTTYTGTADLNKSNDSGGAGGNAVTTDFADGDTVPVITGNCVVKKVADTAGVLRGQVVKIGAADGAEVGDMGSAATKYMIGRARMTATSGNTFPMRQY